MGNTRRMVSKGWAAAAVIAVGAAIVAVGCGDDGATPVCTNVPPYPNRGDEGPGGTSPTAEKIQLAVDEGCLTAVQSGFAGSGAGGAGGSP